jgi:two-component system chemotaxis response regulator CheB
MEGLRQIVAGLPASFPAAVLVCLHLAPRSPSQLPQILDAAGPLPARAPAHGERLQNGVILVAVPDRHLVVHEDMVHLSRSPKENRHRPAVDALFNSAARWHGPDVIGVVLSGALDDGASGAAAIAAQDGTVIVQDPLEARVAAMPSAAVAAVRRARVAPVADIAAVLRELLDGAAEASSAPPPSPLLAWESGNVDSSTPASRPAIPGTPVALACPDCHGGMFDAPNAAGAPHYICHVGHSWSPESLMAAQHEASEAALYGAAAKLLEEATVLRRLAARRHDEDDAPGASELSSKADHAATRAERIQAMLEAPADGHHA